MKQIFVKKSAVKGRSGRRDCRIERALVSNSVRTTEEVQLISVQVQDLVDGKKEGFVREFHLANFRKVRS